MVYWGYIGVMEKKMETTIMENQMENTIQRFEKNRGDFCALPALYGCTELVSGRFFPVKSEEDVTRVALLGGPGPGVQGEKGDPTRLRAVGR